MKAKLLALLALVFVTGCVRIAPPIRLDGSRGELEALVGNWSGEYLADSPQSRGGSISFRLFPEDDHAHGSVVMIPEGSSRAYERYVAYPGMPPYPIEPPARPGAEVLTIRMARVWDGSVSGMLDPYWDPDRQCEAFTTFHGLLRDDVIEGTFTATFAKVGEMMTGRWKVKRSR